MIMEDNEHIGIVLVVDKTVEDIGGVGVLIW